MVLRPFTVVLIPETVEPRVVALLCTVLIVLLIVAKSPARSVTALMAMGKVAYCELPGPPEPPPLELELAPSVLLCLTAETVNAVVLGGTCQVSVQVVVPSLLL